MLIRPCLSMRLILAFSTILVDSDPAMKASLEAKLTEFKRRSGLVLHDDQAKKNLSDVNQKEALGGLSHLIIHAAVLSAVALKKSSIPGTIYSYANCAEQTLTCVHLGRNDVKIYRNNKDWLFKNR